MDAFSPKNNSTIIPPVDPWKKYMPSKKIGIALLVILAVFLVYLFKDRIIVAINSITQKQIITTTIPVPIASTNNQPLSFEKDSDGDGLADWQETLIGSDPNDPDSIAEIPEEIRELATASGAMLDTGDKLALAIFERLKSNPTGTTVEEGFSSAAAKELLDLADSLDQQLTTYTLLDINLVDDTPESRTFYKTQMTGLLNTLQPSELVLKKTFEYISGTSPNPDAGYQTKLAQGINDLLTIPVPLKLAELHLELTNAITHSYAIIESLSRHTGDEAYKLTATLVFQKNLNLGISSATNIINLVSLPY